ncbi:MULTISPECIES: formate/nitrite transporter family protein [unclassified Haladaptatus]|uniref:formate/nitrite transporter family protein n=1 Tax=unclassified Haladaptatus TaxID=2622732 RepID=UPI00209C2F45|nr:MULTISPECIES: formate/nitrite transporter family protein [unclassified Haladaptatus]MCO8245040.1 formate/nitrite transporter family protein [Haladaptatus sp. AB643]MCO8253182.1 formate/nitrite transporter family protein [Haladaptatus sp. AB618]
MAQSTNSDTQADGLKSYENILREQINLGLEELQRPTSGLFLSGLSAGLDIGFGPLLMAVMTGLMTGSLSKPVTELLMANMYAVGFIFVILGRSELFTEHTTLAVLPVLDKRASYASLARLWVVVFVANIIGGALFAAFAVTIAPKLGIAHAKAFTEISAALVKHDFLVLVGSGIFAGWLMGLLSWLVTAARDTVSRVLIIWIVTTAIGLAHLPHSIAGNVEVLMGMFLSAKITFVDYARFLLAATIGNAIGGVFFVALLKYGHVTRNTDAENVDEVDTATAAESE